LYNFFDKTTGQTYGLKSQTDGVHTMQDLNRFIPHNITISYSLHTTKSVHLAFKFYLTKNVRLDCIDVQLIKRISSTKKPLYRGSYGANQILK